MEKHCCHHPDVEAAETCCYCGRHFCQECLNRNAQGKYFCKREEECLAYQEGDAAPGQEFSPVTEYLLDETALDRYEQRITEILEELEDLQGLMQKPKAASESGEAEVPAEAQDTPETVQAAGFCALKVAEQGAALLDLLLFRTEFMCRKCEFTGRAPALQEWSRLKDYLNDQAGPKIRKALEGLKEYEGLDPESMLEPVLRDLQEERNPDSE